MNSWSNWSSSELWESAHHEDDFNVFTEIFNFHVEKVVEEKLIFEMVSISLTLNTSVKA